MGGRPGLEAGYMMPEMDGRDLVTRVTLGVPSPLWVPVSSRFGPGEQRLPLVPSLQG